MSDERLLNSVLEKKKWKDKYIVEWCSMCNTFAITCPVCKFPSCSGGGCTECLKDQDDWNKTKHLLQHYLSLDEVAVYYKCERLKKFMMESFQQSESEIDWKRLIKNGELSEHDEFLFKELINE